jgi:hypothetical protein
MAFEPFSTTQISQLTSALNPTVTETAASPLVLSDVTTPAQSTNTAENKTSGAPSNTPIAATGNATKAASAITKSNQNLAHACDTGSYVSGAIGFAGSIIGTIVHGFMVAIKAALGLLGINPSGAGISNYVQKLMEYVQDIKNIINSINKFLAQFQAALVAIQKVLAFILSLPAQLMAYFKDCISLLKNQLVASYQQALNSTGNVSSAQISSVTDTVNSVTSSANAALTTINNSATQTVVPPTGDSAITQFFSSAGFSSTANNFSKA